LGGAISRAKSAEISARPAVAIFARTRTLIREEKIENETKVSMGALRW